MRRNKEPRAYLSPLRWTALGVATVAGLLLVQEGTGGNDPKPVHPMPSFPVPTPISTTTETTPAITPQELRICDNIFADVGPTGVEELIVQPVVNKNNMPLEISNPTYKKSATFPSPRPRSEILWLAKDGTPLAAPACYPLSGGVRPIDVHPLSNQALTETILVTQESKLANNAIVDLSLGALVSRGDVVHQNVYVIPGTTLEDALTGLN